MRDVTNITPPQTGFERQEYVNIIGITLTVTYRGEGGTLADLAGILPPPQQQLN